VNLAIAEGSKFNRRHVLGYWLVANGLWKTAPPDKWAPKETKAWFWKKQVSLVDQAIGRIRSGELDPCDSVNRMIDHLRANRKSSSTILGARGLVLRFFRYCRLNLDPDGPRFGSETFSTSGSQRNTRKNTAGSSLS
jgi:hypothetical protein